MPSMAEILIPARSPDDWRHFLAEPEKHWRTGRSAKSLAYCWQAARDFPPSVRRVFKESPYRLFHEIEMLLGLVEHQVPLPGAGFASHTDLFVLAKSGSDLVSITVEGKAGEKFDALVSHWLLRDTAPSPDAAAGVARGAADTLANAAPDEGTGAGGRGEATTMQKQRTGPSAGKLKRLAHLCQMLELDEATSHDLWYQLLHRTVSALIEAKRFNAPHALMLVHSFNPKHERFEDYAAFARRLGVAVEPDRIVEVGKRAGINLYLGWVHGEAEWAQA
jgi:uncharacterized protein DUF6946